MQDTVNRRFEALSRANERAESDRESSVISLDLGRRPLCLSEVLGLRPDMQMEVPFKPGMTVRLRVNGRVAGRGECVSLGRTLGVRVIEVYVAAGLWT